MQNLSLTINGENVESRIDPGTTLRFTDGAALICNGRIVAKGTPDQRRASPFDYPRRIRTLRRRLMAAAISYLRGRAKSPG